MTAIDHVMQPNESLLIRKQFYYIEQEQALFTTLYQVWRQPEHRMALRLIAMASIGAMRLALQAWREQEGRREPVANFLQEAFDNLKMGL